MPPPSKPMFWFRTPKWMLWFGEESFWKDVATRTISGVIIVALGYLFGRGAGTIPPPTNENLAFDVLVVAVAFVVFLVMAFFLAVLLDIRVGGPPTRTLVVPGSGDVFRQAQWNNSSRQRKAVYYTLRVLVVTLPFWGTAAASTAILLAFAPP